MATLITGGGELKICHSMYQLYVIFLSQDKEVRAVFLCLLVSLLGDYEQFVTVLRFHPQPSFAFNKVHVWICRLIESPSWQKVS